MLRKYLSLLLLLILVAAAGLFAISMQESMSVAVPRMSAGIPIDLRNSPKQLKDIAETPEGRDVLAQPAPTGSGEKSDRRLKSALSIEEKLSRCLPENLCGQTPKPGVAYFDPARTPAHWMLNKSLRFLLDAARSQPAAVFPSDENLIHNLGIPNAETQRLSVELYARNGLTIEKLDELLMRTDLVAEDAATSFFGILLRQSERISHARGKIFERLVDSLAQRDLNWMFDLVEGLPKLSPDARETRSIVESICRVKEDARIQHNWKMLRLKTDAYIQSRGFALSAEGTCNQGGGS